MLITQDLLNRIFCKLMSYPVGNIFTPEGFNVLADWSAAQDWWGEFAAQNKLGPYWRNSYMCDPYGFAVLLFPFVRDLPCFKDTCGEGRRSVDSCAPAEKRSEISEA